MRDFARMPVAIVFASMVITGCGGDDAPEATSTPEAPPVLTITIRDFKYEPAELQAPVGATIKITNADTMDHTVTASDKTTFDTGPLRQGQTATFTIGKPGTYSYFCSIHSYMTGVIQVA